MIRDHVTIGAHIRKTYGIAVTVDPIPLAGVMNENHSCASADGTRYIFKVYLQKDAAEVGFEMEVLDRIRMDNFETPRIRRTLEGSCVSKIDGHPSVLYPFVEGEMPTQLDHNQLLQVGRMTALIHVCLRGFNPRVSRQAWDPEGIANLLERRGGELIARNIPGAGELLRFVRGELRNYSFPSDLPRGILHEDVKPENVVVRGGSVIGIVDFDNCRPGLLVTDVLTTAIWSCFDGPDLDRSRLQSLVRGYESVRPLEPDESRLLGTLLRWRLLREVFIAPLVTVGHTDIVVERSTRFKEMYVRLRDDML